MPTFSSAQVTDPFLSQNELLAPMLAHIQAQEKLGNLDINRQELKLKQDEAARTQAFDAYRTQSLPTGDGTGATSGGGAVGPLADAAPDQSRDAAGQASYNFWVSKGLAPHQAAGMAAQEVAESGGRPGVPGDGGQAYGLYQHHADRRALILAKAGIDMNKPDANAQREGAYWELMNSEHEARRRLFAATDPDQAGRAATEFERPDSKRRAIIDAERGRDARRIFSLANPNGATVATATVDPRAGPREANLLGNAPITTGRYAPTVTSPVAPAAPVADPAVVNNPATPPVTTGQADDTADPNTAAVKQASAALLNMPEADAAAAYPAVVKELQARGFAMNAPPTYPGHAALQALVGGGDQAAPAIEPSRQAMRLGGTDVAGPPGVVRSGAATGTESLPAIEQPHRLYQTGLAGVTINGPGNTLAPPPGVAAPAAAPAQAQPQAANPQPPPAPSRTVQREPLIQSGLYTGLTLTQARTIAQTPGLKPAAFMDQIATQRHQNDVIRQGDATQRAIEEKENYDRGRQGESDARAKEQLRLQQEDAALKAKADKRAEDAAKDRGLPTGWRMSEDGKTAYQVAGLTDPEAGKQTERTFNQENKLRDEFQKLTGDFRIVQTSFENIRSAAKANDGAGDMSMLYNYVRLLDPTSVVRESEFAAAAASGSFGQRVQGAVERVLSGARMPESLRESFIREGKNLYNNQLRSHNTVADQYETLAKANGLDPGRVVTRFARPQEDDSADRGPVTVKTPSEAEALKPGTPYQTPDGRKFVR